MKLHSLIPALAISGSSASVLPFDALSQVSKREVNGSFIPSTAPYENIFAQITPEEETSVVKFLKGQANKTLPGDLDFEYSFQWLLAPNKTDALSYLNGDGPKPGRHARITGYANCYTREYMVGPLPVSDLTKAVPLDYANNGNATLDVECLDDGGNFTTASEASDPNGRRLGTQRVANSKRNDNSGIRRRSPHNPYEEKMGWNGDELPHDKKQPPVTILPDGARHEFDPEQNFVSWMDYTFFVGTGPGGISLHDVRFKGERIIYELAMQEALAHYSGPDEDQNIASYLDVAVGFTNFNLIPGYDCPSYATYKEEFCLFEFPKDYPMSRHNDGSYFHATKNIAFMLRSISTVGNYDYQTTYEFHYDGSIEVVVRATGYIQASDFVNGTEPWDYGFKIRSGLSGSMHDHVLNFKADLDIKGTQNSLFKTEFVPNSQVYPWSKGKVFNNMKVERSFIETEDEGKINWAPNSAASYAVVNKDKPNQFGEYPGFKIYPSTGSSIHLTVENSSVFPNHIDWSTHQLYALQRKDSEPVAAHPQGGFGTEAGTFNFRDFFNSESLDQEDLVLYFNLGMHHMPDTYDLPVTVFQGAQSGITLRPQNYQRSDSAISTRQQMHVTTDDNGNKKVNKYGVEDLSGSYDLKSANPPWIPFPDY